MFGIYEIPETTMKPENEQTKMSISVYRGKQQGTKIPDEGSSHLYDNGSLLYETGYANFDTLNIELEDYSANIDGPAPQLSLRWHGDKGIANQLLDKYLFWRRYAFRPVTKKMKLSMLDIADTPIYKPRQIGESVYFIKEISVAVDVDTGDLDEATTDLLAR